MNYTGIKIGGSPSLNFKINPNWIHITKDLLPDVQGLGYGVVYNPDTDKIESDNPFVQINTSCIVLKNKNGLDIFAAAVDIGRRLYQEKLNQGK